MQVDCQNLHKHLEQFHTEHNREPDTKEHWRIVTEASIEVGPALFFSLIIITLSFVPVFALEAQEGRLFAPLAYTKTFAMAAAALLSVTLTLKLKMPTALGVPLSRPAVDRLKPVGRLPVLML